MKTNEASNKSVNPSDLIRQALAVSDRTTFDTLVAALHSAGATYQRPVGDLPGNLSAISASGDPEHLVLELITNGQDALLERHAASLRNARQAVPSQPRDLASEIGWPGDTKTNQSLAKRLKLSFRDSGDRVRPTITVRDRGIGIDVGRARKTILSLMNAPKSKSSYLIGNYGKGGSTMYRDGLGAVLIGRPSPELIAESGCEDRVWVTVVDAVHDNGKIDTWTYLVTSEWDPDRPAETAPLLSFPAGEVDFDPGILVTHVSYAAPNLGNAPILRDRNSIYVLGNTRLFDPVLPWSVVDDRAKQTHSGMRGMYGSRSNFISGEQRQLKASPLDGHLIVPDPDGQGVFKLPIMVFLFEEGSRWSSTARDHVVLFTSNGQVQAHWGSVDTRTKTAEVGQTLTGLRRVAEKIMLVDVDLDPIPARIRSRVVSADRTRFTDVPLAKAIQRETARWLNEQAVLQELEKELSLERSRGTEQISVKSKTLDEIARKLGFIGTGGRGTGNPRPPKQPAVLLAEPTELSGHEKISIISDMPRTVHFSLNAKDGFLPDHGATVELNIDGANLLVEPAPSSLRSGRFSLEVLIGQDVAPTLYTATAAVTFLAAAGGTKTLEWPFKVEVLSEPPPPSNRPGANKKGRRPIVRWHKGDSAVVGDVSDGFTGVELAELYEDPEYAKLGDERLTVIEVNPNYLSFRKYLDAVAEKYGDQTVRSREERYLVGTAVALSKVLGAIPGSDRDPFPTITSEDRQQLLGLAADAIVAALPPKE